MNYQKIHDSIIVNAKNRGLPVLRKNFEKHHIVPKSVGGKDDPENLVFLTPREHFLVHKLLTKFFTGLALKKMINAFCYMAFTTNNKRLNRSVSARDYDLARRICKDGMYTEERNKKISKAWAERREAGWKQVRTDETKQKHKNTLKQKADAGLGQKHTEEFKKAMSKRLIGNTQGKNHKVSDKHKAVLSEALSKEYKIIFPDKSEKIIKNLSKYCEEVNAKRPNLGIFLKTGPLKGCFIQKV
jgi:hypothetical protein